MRKFVYIVGNPNRIGLNGVHTSLELIEVYEFGSGVAYGSLDIYEIDLPENLSLQIASYSVGSRLPRATLDTTEVAEHIGRALAQRDRLLDEECVVTALVEVINA